MLKYHQTTFDITLIDPIIDEENLHQLDLLEDLLGFSLPPSVREWYSLSGVNDLIVEFSNDDYPISLNKLVNNFHTFGAFSHYSLDLISNNMLPFMIENQAVFICTIKLDGSDDPPVFFWDDDNEWKKIDENFSSFLSHWVWNFLIYRDYFKTSLIAEEGPFKGEYVEELRDVYNELLLGEHDSSVIHLSRKSQHITIWRENTDTTHWWLSAGSQAALLEVAKDVWQYGTLSTTLRGQGGGSNNAAALVLKKLRQDT